MIERSANSIIKYYGLHKIVSTFVRMLLVNRLQTAMCAGPPIYLASTPRNGTTSPVLHRRRRAHSSSSAPQWDNKAHIRNQSKVQAPASLQSESSSSRRKLGSMATTTGAYHRRMLGSTRCACLPFQSPPRCACSSRRRQLEVETHACCLHLSSCHSKAALPCRTCRGRSYDSPTTHTGIRAFGSSTSLRVHPS